MHPKTTIYFLSAVLCLGIFAYFFLRPPAQFPAGSTVNIEAGSSAGKAAQVLRANKIIRSAAAFKFFVVITGGEKRIRPAYYTFEQPIPVFEVAYRLSGGRSMFSEVKVTIPEGFDRSEIADAFAKKLPNFQKEQFLLLVEGKEGRLFPDTYFFLNTDGAAEAFQAMSENYEEKISPLRGEIAAAGRTEQDIIIMASIIEGEAAGDLDRALISGILWKRLGIGMALQADAAPATYEARGLPEEPIGNPGLAAIEAALFPEESSFLYYLHDDSGSTYYARNFAEHRANIQKHLK